MIWSQWRPDTGGYDYYETAKRHALGEDLPVPLDVGGTSIGVASTEIGRKPDGPARRIGSGPMARGSVMPIDRSGLSGLSLTFSWRTLVVAALAGAAGWYARKTWWR